MIEFIRTGDYDHGPANHTHHVKPMARRSSVIKALCYGLVVGSGVAAVHALGLSVLLDGVGRGLSAIEAWYRPHVAVFGPLGHVIAAAIASTGVIIALITLIWNGVRDRRRKTLEACEGFWLDTDKRTILALVITAARNGTFPLDTEDPRPGSLREQASFLLNYLETISQGACLGMYSRWIVRLYMKDFANFFHDHFLNQQRIATVSVRWINAPFPYFRRVFRKPKHVALTRDEIIIRIVESLDTSAWDRAPRRGV